MKNCMQCGADLSQDEIGLHKKLVNRASVSFCCIHCLAKKFQVPVEELRDMIERFRRTGCLLFVQPPNDAE